MLSFSPTTSRPTRSAAIISRLHPTAAAKRMAILLGDVAGKGVTASAPDGQAQRRRAVLYADGARSRHRSHQAQLLDEQSGISDQFVTLVAAVLDSENTRALLLTLDIPSLLYKNRNGQPRGDC